MLARILRRPLVPSAVASSPVSRTRGIEEFFDSGKKIGEKVEAVGRGWEAWELRQKSFSDLHKLWYVLLKEKNLLYSQKEILRSLSSPMVQPHRIVAVRKSMCRIKQVLTERALGVEDASKKEAYRSMINCM